MPKVHIVADSLFGPRSALTANDGSYTLTFPKTETVWKIEYFNDRIPFRQLIHNVRINEDASIIIGCGPLPSGYPPVHGAQPNYCKRTTTTTIPAPSTQSGNNMIISDP